MRLLEKINPVNPISFRKQTFCTSRHKRSLSWQKYPLQTDQSFRHSKNGVLGSGLLSAVVRSAY